MPALLIFVQILILQFLPLEHHQILTMFGKKQS